MSFRYVNHALYCEGVSLAAIAASLMKPTAELVGGRTRIGPDPDTVTRQRPSSAFQQDRIEAGQHRGVALLERGISIHYPGS